MKNKKIGFFIGTLVMSNILMLSSVAAETKPNMLTGIRDAANKNAEQKIQSANDATDKAAALTFMNSHLKLDKAFTKRYNELKGKDCAPDSTITIDDKGCDDKHNLTADTTEKTNQANIDFWVNKMNMAQKLSALGNEYKCAKKAYEKCQYIGGAGGWAKTESFFTGKDVRGTVKGLNTNVSTNYCSSIEQEATANMNTYLDSLKNCEEIKEITLSKYTEADLDNAKKNLADKETAYDDAKEKENSTANKLLTAGSMATMGIGAMELARGLSEQKADKEADADMAAYIETFRCTYGKDKSVKAGPQEIELPGGNDQNIMKYRSEYLALAPDLKARKEALGLKPGIESEEILDKTQMGLYDQENVGITSGNYESLYRAQMLGSEADKAKINDNAEASKRRVIAGAVVGGVGLVGSVVGNSLINGKLGEAIKNKKVGKETQALLKKEAQALENLQKCLKSAGFQATDKLTFTNFYPSIFEIPSNCSDFKTLKNNKKANDLTAANLFVDETDAKKIFEELDKNFTRSQISTLIGYTIGDSDNSDKAIAHLQKNIESVQKKFKDAEEKDKESAKSLGIDLSGIASGFSNGAGGMSTSIFSNFGENGLSGILGGK